jgi:hypothetical protein
MNDLEENQQQEQAKEQKLLDKAKYYSNLTFIAVKPYVYPAISIIGIIPWTIIGLIVGLIATIGAIFLGFSKQNAEQQARAIRESERTSGQWPSLISPAFYVKLVNFLVSLIVVQIVWRLGKLALGIPQDVKMSTSLFWVINSIQAHIRPNDKTFILGCGFLVLIFIKVVFMLLAMAGLMPTPSQEFAPSGEVYPHNPSIPNPSIPNCEVFDCD